MRSTRTTPRRAITTIRQRCSTGEWGPNQHGKATAHVEKPTDEWFQEVQIRLRCTLAPHSISGYEIFFRCLKGELGYAEIVRWNGAVGDWTSLQRETGPEYGVEHGDVIEAKIEGDAITGYVNGVDKITTVDDTLKTGAPGSASTSESATPTTTTDSPPSRSRPTSRPAGSTGSGPADQSHLPGDRSR